MNDFRFYKSVLLSMEALLNDIQKRQHYKKFYCQIYIHFDPFSVHKFQFSKVSFIFPNNLFISELRKGYLNPTLLLYVTWAIKIKEDSFYALLSPMR